MSEHHYRCGHVIIRNDQVESQFDYDRACPQCSPSRVEVMDQLQSGGQSLYGHLFPLPHTAGTGYIGRAIREFLHGRITQPVPNMPPAKIENPDDLLAAAKDRVEMTSYIIAPTKPDLRKIAEVIAEVITEDQTKRRTQYYYYAVRAVPVSDLVVIGTIAERSHVWEDCKPTDQQHVGTDAIILHDRSFRFAAPCLSVERAFARAANLLRQYALVHADTTPQRRYRLLVLGSDCAEPLETDLEISMVDAVILYSEVLGCVGAP